MQHWWLIASLGLIVVSTALVLFALRGRRVNDHPICRRCGFDLFGKPQESRACSECGADLAARKAVCIGHRERRGRVLGIAVPMLVVAIGSSGWAGWRRVSSVDWTPHKPAWWLEREANGHDPVARDSALIELARRIGAGRLPRERVDALVSRALDLQADRSRPWAPGWGTIVEAAHDTGCVSKEQWQQYMVQAVTYVLEPLKSPVRRCDRFDLRLRTGADRIGAVTVTRGQAVEGLRLGVYTEPQVFIDGRPVELDEPYARRYDAFLRGDPPPPAAHPGGVPLLSSVVLAGPLRPKMPRSDAATIRVANPPPDWLADGRHTARVRLHLVPLGAARDERRNATYEPAGPVQSIDLDTAWTLVPSPRVNPDPAFRQAVESALVAERLVYRPYHGSNSLSGIIRCRGTPVPLAYSIFIMSGGREAYIGSACFVPGGFLTAVTISGQIGDLSDDAPETVDIVFRPNPAVASPDMTEIWGGEVILRNVPVAKGNAAYLAPKWPPF